MTIVVLLMVDLDIASAQIPRPIHFLVTVSDTQLSNSRGDGLLTNVSAETKRFAKGETIEDSDLELRDLGPGLTYYAIPDGAGSVALTPDDGVASVGSGGQVDIVGDTNTQSIVSFVLPERLYPTGGTGNGFVTVRFNSTSAAWGDAGAEVHYFDPSSPTTVSLGASGSVSIVLGGVFEVSAKAGPDAYEGEASLTVSGDTIAHLIHFLVQVRGFVILPGTTDLELSNLVSGRSYSATPDGAGSITLTPKDGVASVISKGGADFVAFPNTQLLVSWVMPSRLYLTSGSGTGFVTVRFDSTSTAWGIAGAEVHYFDPHTPTGISLDSAGTATIVLGGLFQVDSGTAAGTYEGEALVTAQFVTSVDQHSDAHYPISFELSQNYPNPFNPTTTIRYQIPTSSNVQLGIFDIMGREVATLVKDLMAPGEYFAKLDASSYSSGIYFYKLEAGSYSQVKKLVLIR